MLLYEYIAGNDLSLISYELDLHCKDDGTISILENGFAVK